ncbi:MAG: agmatinase [Candidatus Omnitrophica bacterium]|nr:agmatinase [Candidatus Omnitrophota bacterium]
MENKISQEELIPVQFGGEDNDCSTYEKAKAVIVPVPYGKTVCYKPGTENGPRAILDASRNLELFDDELGKDTYRIGIHTAAELEVHNFPPEEMVAQVEKKVASLIKDSKFPIIVGGEHTVSVGAVRALAKANKDMSVLYLDAHYDMRDSFKGLKLSHACVARRISEICPTTIVGSRSFSKEEKNALPNPNVHVFNVYDILDIPNWKEKIKDSVRDSLYISIDLDVLDPSIMPSVGTPEPGGLGWYEILDLLHYIIEHKELVGMDIVELCPIKDMVAPDFMAAKLIYRLLGYNFVGGKKIASKKDNNGTKKEGQ